MLHKLGFVVLRKTFTMDPASVNNIYSAAYEPIFNGISEDGTLTYDKKRLQTKTTRAKWRTVFIKALEDFCIRTASWRVLRPGLAATPFTSGLGALIELREVGVHLVRDHGLVEGAAIGDQPLVDQAVELEHGATRATVGELAELARRRARGSGRSGRSRSFRRRLRASWRGSWVLSPRGRLAESARRRCSRCSAGRMSQASPRWTARSKARCGSSSRC
jgi:hypothetical protein